MNRVVLSLILAAATGCGTTVETSSAMPTTDPLYQQVEAECGDEALVVRVVDSLSDEALCCVSYTLSVPRLHCMTAKGQTVVNPTPSKLRDLSAQ